jgi:hypothetical protein
MSTEKKELGDYLETISLKEWGDLRLIDIDCRKNIIERNSWVGRAHILVTRSSIGGIKIGFKRFFFF